MFTAGLANSYQKQKLPMTDRRNAPEAVLREILEMIDSGGLNGPARGWVVKRIRDALANQPAKIGEDEEA
ncbi:MAG: hypothetical protein R3316_13010 [Rhodovibrionaceae bacterium]|nr:hypothetical protein [Rhodovibrionaceae bacterium]